MYSSALDRFEQIVDKLAEDQELIVSLEQIIEAGSNRVLDEGVWDNIKNKIAGWADKKLADMDKKRKADKEKQAKQTKLQLAKMFKNASARSSKANKGALNKLKAKLMGKFDEVLVDLAAREGRESASAQKSAKRKGGVGKTVSGKKFKDAVAKLKAARVGSGAGGSGSGGKKKGRKCKYGGEWGACTDKKGRPYKKRARKKLKSEALDHFLEVAGYIAESRY